MSLLALVLATKIIITALLTGLPFLFLPARKLAIYTGVTGGGIFFRLYGIAIVSLLVGYASGFWTISRGEFPWGVVIMGLVSNGAGSVVLISSGSWRNAKLMSILVTAIAILLGIAVAFPSAALRTLW